MRWGKGMVAGTVAVAAGCSLALSPALSAMLGADTQAQQEAPVSLKMLGSIASFTPVTNDTRLARAYASAARESQSRGFRFTPSSGSVNGRSLTILVRAGALSSARASSASERVLPNLGVAPVGYRLGTTKGLDRFSTGARLDPAMPDPLIDTKMKEPLPNYVLRGKPDRFSANLQLQARDGIAGTPAVDAPQTVGSERSYAVDISSSYSLTRNLNVQAGLRYKGASNRLAPVVTDQTQDSQAVYVGTTFKF